MIGLALAVNVDAIPCENALNGDGAQEKRHRHINVT
jgi:hypothetical protein